MWNKPKRQRGERGEGQVLSFILSREWKCGVCERERSGGEKGDNTPGCPFRCLCIPGRKNNEDRGLNAFRHCARGTGDSTEI